MATDKRGCVLFSFMVPVGGFSTPFQTCSAILNGTATNVTATSIVGTYTGTNSCSGPFTNGTITLTKQ